MLNSLLVCETELGHIDTLEISKWEVTDNKSTKDIWAEISPKIQALIVGLIAAADDLETAFSSGEIVRTNTDDVSLDIDIDFGRHRITSGAYSRPP